MLLQGNNGHGHCHCNCRRRCRIVACVVVGEQTLCRQNHTFALGYFSGPSLQQICFFPPFAKRKASTKKNISPPKFALQLCVFFPHFGLLGDRLALFYANSHVDSVMGRHTRACHEEPSSRTTPWGRRPTRLLGPWRSPYYRSILPKLNRPTYGI